MSLLRRFSKRLDYAADSRKPYNTDGARPQSGYYEKEAADLVGGVVPALSISDMPAFLDAVKNMGSVGLDDRKMLLEAMVEWMSKRKDTALAAKVQQVMINLLYKDLPHPPSGYVCLPPPPPPAAAVYPNGNSTTPTNSTTTPTPAPAPVPYAFRAADGSNYNPLFPTLGQAGSPYARSVPSTNPAPRNTLPDAGLLFDTLLRRGSAVGGGGEGDTNGTSPHAGFKPHPDGISSLFFAFADLVIHSIFDTDHHSPGTAGNSLNVINKTSSYLDLSILYGNSAAEAARVRRADGTGRLHADVWADWRLLHMPPASCALGVLLSRNHDFIAQRILDINERGTYVPVPEGGIPTGADPIESALRQKLLAQDEELFQRARLVNCGFFMHIILGDYVGAILGLARDQSAWRLDPLQSMRALDHALAPVGEGNVVSVEFNLLYRWHATLSERDERWFREEVFEGAFGGRGADEVTPQDFLRAAHTTLVPPEDLKTWTFGGLQRDADGRFADADLARILHDATESVAGSFGARNIPEHMRVIEIMAIEQGRSWGTCSLNEFRKFLGLKPYASFKEWNPDETIHTAAAALYRDIDNLELHVGLQAEEIKSPRPGAGLCPGYTISRAILADAVCLTRGDRFLTADFTPHNLTAWGFQDCQYDTADGSFGGLLTKLLFRTLPAHFPAGSAYAHFPFLVPARFERTLAAKSPEQAARYTWTRPRPAARTVVVDDYEGVRRVLGLGAGAGAGVGAGSASSGVGGKERERFLASYERGLGRVVEGALFKKTLSIKGSPFQSNGAGGHLSDKARAEQEAVRARFARDTAAASRYVFGKKSAPEAAAYFGRKTREMMYAKSFDTVGRGTKAGKSYVDVVKDVVNLVPVYWLALEVLGLPLKTQKNESGVMYEHDTYDRFAEVAEYVYLNFDATNDWHLREAAQRTAADCIDIIKAHIDKVDSWVSLSDTHNHTGMSGSSGCHASLKAMWTQLGKGKAGGSYREFAAQLFAATVPTAALFSQAVAAVVDFFLADTEAMAAARREIVRLDASTEEDANVKAMVYFYEALRVNSPISGVYRTATEPDNFKTMGPVKAGDTIFADIRDANLDESVFGPNASTPDFSRPAGKAGIFGFVNQGFMTPEFLQNTVPPMLAAIFKQADLKRAPGESGTLAKFEEGWNATQRTLYPSQRGFVTPWPESLIVHFSKQK